jgi:hypothetical protein
MALSIAWNALVVPAKAGTHFDLGLREQSKWIPAFAGMTIKSQELEALKFQTD